MLKRRLLYGVFVVAFVIAAPLLLLYASGYRYNDRIGIVQKTGAIFVHSNPQDVQIYLNGERKKNLGSELRITRLLPEEYDVRISADGYRDWNRMIMVRPFETTFLNHIQLFLNYSVPEYIAELPGNVRESAETTDRIVQGTHAITVRNAGTSYELVRGPVISGNVDVLTTLPRGSYTFIPVADPWIAVYDETHYLLYFFELSRDHEEIVHRSVLSDVRGFDILENKQHIAVYTPLELWTVDLDHEGMARLVTRLSTGIQRAVWHPEGGYLYYQSGDHVRVVELVHAQDQQQYDLAAIPNMTDMRVNTKGDVLYFNATIGNQTGWYQLTVQ